MRIESITDCPVCRESEPQFGRQPKQHNHEHLRAVIIVADAPNPGGSLWQEVPDKTFVSVSHSLDLSEAPIQI